MHKKRLGLCLLLPLLGASIPATAGHQCADDETAVAVRGKIYNNAISAGETLGVMHMKLGDQRMKCGLMGQGGASPDGSLNFVHTFVCDDSAVFAPTGEMMHSQLTLNTTGVGSFQACAAAYPAGSVQGAFVETSAPIAGTGRGVFDGVEQGQIFVTGTVNCLGAVDMLFGGVLCLKSEP